MLKDLGMSSNKKPGLIRALLCLLATSATFSSLPAGAFLHLGSGAKYELSVTGPAPAELDSAKNLFDETIAAFESKVAPLKHPIKIAVGAPGCLRVGYSFTNEEVEFCAAKNVLHFGLGSRDVIRHELFHAMVCQLRPELCTVAALSSTLITGSHEGLADFFAHELHPSDCFGEGFYDGQQCVRHYSTELCYSLVSGSHEKGNALVSALVGQNVALEKLRETILSSDFFAPTNDAMKTLYPGASIEWRDSETGAGSSLFQITAASSPNSFQITPVAEKGVEKLIAQIGNSGAIIGSIPFYIGIKRNTPSGEIPAH